MSKLMCLPCSIAKKLKIIKEKMTVGVCSVCHNNRVVGEVQS